MSSEFPWAGALKSLAASRMVMAGRRRIVHFLLRTFREQDDHAAPISRVGASCRGDTSQNIQDLGSTRRYDRGSISFRSCRRRDGASLAEACWGDVSSPHSRGPRARALRVLFSPPDTWFTGTRVVV